MSALHWSAQYIGLPWREDAEGPDAYDCKGLTRHVQRKHYGKEVPRLLGVARLPDWASVREAAEKEGWRPIRDQDPKKARDGDIIVVHDQIGAHVGTIITMSLQARMLWVLHSRGTPTAGGAVRCDRLVDVMAAYGRPVIWRNASGENE